MMTDTDEFDWGPLGVAWWLDTAKQLGAEPRQTKFAACKVRGCSNTQAAKEAGYTASTEGGFRSTGYRLARSNIVERLLAFAAGEGADYDGSVDREEARRILSSLARGSDPSVRIRAIEQLNKMDEADKQGEVKEDQSPEQALREIAAISPEMAAFLASENDTPLDWLPPEVRGTAHLEQFACNWIRDNPARAIEIARYFLQPPNGTNVNQHINGNGATR